MMKHRIKCIALCVLALLMLQAFACAQAAQLHVSGSATVYVEADCASASLGVNLSGPDLGVLQQQANETVNAIYEALLQAGMSEEDISTDYLYISPVYDYSGPQESIVGYTVSSSLAIRTENIDSLGIYIDAAFAAGANSLGSVSFSVQDDTQARNRALELALQDARQKAEVIAGASGMQLGEVLEIREGGAGTYAANAAAGRTYAMDAAGGAMDGTSVHAARVAVTANIDICYELR